MPRKPLKLILLGIFVLFITDKVEFVTQGSQVQNSV